MEEKELEWYLYGSDSSLKRRKYLHTCGDLMTAAYLAIADAVSDVSAGLGSYKIHTVDASDFHQITSRETAFQIKISLKSGAEYTYTYVAELHEIPEQKRLFNI